MILKSLRVAVPPLSDAIVLTTVILGINGLISSLVIEQVTACPNATTTSAPSNVPLFVTFTELPVTSSAHFHTPSEYVPKSTSLKVYVPADVVAIAEPPVVEAGLLHGTATPFTARLKSAKVASTPSSEMMVLLIVKLVSSSVLVTEHTIVSPSATVILPSLTSVSAPPVQLNVPLV